MTDFKFNQFKKGWFYKHQHLVGLDGFNDVNNFVIYKNAIEKVRGWRKLNLHPNSPTYPMVGPNVQSIFEYIKFEEETIRLGAFSFDFGLTYGLPDIPLFVPDFNTPPFEEDGITPNFDSYGLLKTCDHPCVLHDIESEVAADIAAPSGPAVRVSSASTKDNATLYALIYDPIRHTLVFGRWVNASLKTYNQILYVLNNVTYAPGTKLRITEGPPNTFKILVNDVEQFQVIDDEIGLLGPCFGVVQLQLITQGVKSTGSNTAGTTHFTFRSFYCNDGITVVSNLLPAHVANNDFSSPLDITLKSGNEGDTCFGFLRTQLWNETGILDHVDDRKGDYFWLNAQFKSGSGNARSGLAVRMDESKADPKDFTGWGAIVENDWLFLVSWVNQSLESYGTIRGAVNYKLLPDELLSMEYLGRQSFAPSLRRVRIYTATGSTFTIRLTFNDPETIIPIGTQLSDRQSNTNAGFIWLGNDAPGLHTHRWIKPPEAGDGPMIHVDSFGP